MSLFGAKKQLNLKESLKKAKENLEEKMSSAQSTVTTSSSGIGAILEQQEEKITGALPTDPDGTATTSEVAREELGDYLGEGQQVAAAAVTLTREQYNYGVRIHNAEVRADGYPSQVIEPIWGTAEVIDEHGNRRPPAVCTISSDSTSLSSPPPTTNYGGSEISFPSQTPRERVSSPLPTTNYEGSIMGLPPSALNALREDPFSTPRASAGIIARKYIQSEENTNQDAEDEGGMEETLRVYTPIPRKFEASDSSDNEDDKMTEVEWRDESPYMTPTKKGKKRNKGKGVRRPETPDRPIPNMPQTPSRKKLDADWAKPAETLTNENGPVNLEAFVGEYLRNTNGLRDFMATNQLHDERYDEWCLKQAEFMAARQNHTDAGVTSTRKTAEKILTEVELSREYEEERMEKLDQRLEKIERKVAKLAPVNMAKTIENAMRDCMEKMVDQLTDRVVKRFEDAAEESRKKDEIRRGKQVKATPEKSQDMSDVEFEPGATFSEEENEKVAKVIEQMQVDEQELEASRHAPVIPPGEKRQEFPRFTLSGQVTIAKRPVVPAVPEQKKKEVKKPEVKETPKGPKAGEKKKPEVKKPAQQQPAKKPEEKKKETWAQRAAAPPPPKKQPEQRQQQQQSGQQQKKKGDGFTEVKRQQKKEEMKPVPPGQNLMEKRRVTFKRDNGLPLSQKKDLDISSEVNRALFEAKVPHFVRIQGVTKNTRGCLSTITTPAATAEMLIRYREIVIKAARKVDAGIVDIESNELWEKVKMHGVNFDRYLGKKTGGGLEKLRQELQAENEGVVLPLAINWIGGPKDVQKKKAEGKKASSVVFAVKGSKMAEKVLKGGLRAAGVKYDVERFVNAGPDSFCGVCSRWGHVDAKCGSLKMPACMLCAGRHLTKDHKCNVVGCKANAGQNCAHNVDKCVNCKGNHIAKANCCVKKQEAIKTAREERRTWKEREGERRNITTDQQEKPAYTEDGEPSTAEAEKKAQNDEQTEKEPEVQVVATQETEGESSNAGTQETPMKSC